MSLIQLLRLKTWETRLSKIPRLETPHLEMGSRITDAYAHCTNKKMNVKQQAISNFVIQAL